MAAAAAVGVAVVIAAIVSYLVVRDQLRGQIDSSLRAEGNAVPATFHALTSAAPQIPPDAGGPAPYAQVLIGGHVYSLAGDVPLPVTDATDSAATGKQSAFLTDVTVNGSPLREITVSVRVEQTGETGALQLARPLASVDHILNHLRLILLLLVAGGVGLAAALGRLAAKQVLAPLAEVAQTAEQIGETDDLSTRLRIHADDEVGQLAVRFNAMLEHLEASREALDDSVRAQRQLVADASHELRTPVTSLRTNIEVLLAGAQLEEDDRKRLLADVVEQSEELSALVNDLIELARGDEPHDDVDDVRLDRVVAESLARARRNAPSLHFDEHLEPTVVQGVPERLERAVNNLLDNASRHSPPQGVVRVDVNARGVQVRDHGAGVAADDLPFVFDRFFRGSSSRGLQGSGLGLAIVRQVAEGHGGHATAANAPDGGAIFTLELPTIPADEAPGAEPLPGDQPQPSGEPHISEPRAAPANEPPAAPANEPPAAPGDEPPAAPDPGETHAPLWS
jgi:two-component system sensor histidine kinase MprB